MVVKEKKAEVAEAVAEEVEAVAGLQTSTNRN